MVAYLWIRLFIALIADGILFNFTSDIWDQIFFGINSSGLTSTFDADTIYFGQVIVFAFQYCLIFVFFSYILKVLQMSQKPVESW